MRIGPDYKRHGKKAPSAMHPYDVVSADVIRRDSILYHVSERVTLPPGRHKIIILDEADSMTAAAQQALRRTMELFSSTTRFALACNTSSKIIEPIQSRCAVLRYTKLSDTQVLRRLMNVCDGEDVNKTNDGLEAILFTAEGDMRQAINNLQSTHSGYGLVNRENVFKVCDQPHPVLVTTILESCRDQQLRKATWAAGRRDASACADEDDDMAGTGIVRVAGESANDGGGGGGGGRGPRGARGTMLGVRTTTVHVGVPPEELKKRLRLPLTRS